jgi:ABC-type nickel/cobalt efflux system permease component RcnA
MLFKNAVPLSNGILLSTTTSITYFVMSIVTLFFLYGCHEATSYMLLKYTPQIIVFYGAVLLAMGIVCLIIDVGGAQIAVDAKWKVMSVFQKDYFDGKKNKLLIERR